MCIRAKNRKTYFHREVDSISCDESVSANLGELILAFPTRATISVVFNLPEQATSGQKTTFSLQAPPYKKASSVFLAVQNVFAFLFNSKMSDDVALNGAVLHNNENSDLARLLFSLDLPSSVPTHIMLLEKYVPNLPAPV